QSVLAAVDQVVAAADPVAPVEFHYECFVERRHAREVVLLEPEDFHEIGGLDPTLDRSLLSHPQLVLEKVIEVFADAPTLHTGVIFEPFVLPEHAGKPQRLEVLAHRFGDRHLRPPAPVRRSDPPSRPRSRTRPESRMHRSRALRTTRRIPDAPTALSTRRSLASRSVRRSPRRRRLLVPRR